ncbi:MAG TPA: glycosyltransferase [Deltaproteobacteria bacterium]|jgi:colanic acid/amylovoran biosynthesis glycosyltransferase|nr:glycosyltransferase [Deltaproteobacteria bacterium]
MSSLSKNINADGKLTIAYLAPELPALSATFVYQEILELQRNGVSVVPISVHLPGSRAQEDEAKELAGKTRYLYRLPWRTLLANALMTAITRPAKFIAAISVLIGDIFRVGVFSRTAAGLVFRFLVASTVARVLVNTGCRHIHAHFAHVPADIAMYASLLSDVPYSFTAHANDIFVHAWLLEHKVRRSAFTVTISAFNREYLALQGAPPEKIHVVHCGVDAKMFAPHKPREIHRPVRLGSLGRMVEKKGFDILIHACRILKDSGTPFTLELAGDGPLMQDLLTLTRSLGLTGEIGFIGPLAHDRVPGWLDGLDIFVLACRKDRDGDMDGIPVVLMEAMLSGVPVVSTRITGIPELIEDRVSGYLASPEDPWHLASVIEEVIRNDRLRERITRQAVEKIEGEFDLARNVQMLASLFKGNQQ